MASQIYEFLSYIGYNHPLHPAFTHLPVGLTIGSFVFIAIACFLKRPKYIQTAKHCIVLALLAAIPTMVAGYFDWQYFYAGSWLFPIKMKLIFACVLFSLLLILVFAGARHKGATSLRLIGHLLCLISVVCLGYFGGELVYGKISTPIQTIDSDTSNAKSVFLGSTLFNKKCSFCHLVDSTDTKVGPGFKGFFERDKMPVSGWPMSTDSFRKQLKTPFKQMPSFESLTEEEIISLTNYLKAL
jgi:uncharacterized membrane protein